MLALNTVVDGGSFHVLDVLRTGGSTIVYLAFDIHKSTPKSAKYCAIKCLVRNANQSSILCEIRLHKSVSRHENIVTLRRSVLEGEFQILIMDYCPDGNLFSQITQKYRFFGNDELIRDVFLQIIDAVAYCHSRGVYHRDLQPENILCSHDGTKVYLADFGLATEDRISYQPDVGNGCYMSPECSAGPKYDSAMNDVWSLGIILLNLCYGRNPWTRADYSNATFGAFLQDPNYLASILPIPFAVNEILKKVLALDSRRRATLDRLRAAILEVDHFCMNKVELRSTKQEARNVAAALKELMAARVSGPRVADSGSTKVSASPNSVHAPACTPIHSRRESIVSLRIPKPLHITSTTYLGTHHFPLMPNPSGSTPSSEAQGPSAPSVVSRSLGTILHKSSSLIDQAKAQAEPLKLGRLSLLKPRMSTHSVTNMLHPPTPNPASSLTRRHTLSSYDSHRRNHSPRKSDSYTPPPVSPLSHFGALPPDSNPHPYPKRVSLPPPSRSHASGDHGHSMISDSGKFITESLSRESEGSSSLHPFSSDDESENVAIHAERPPASRNTSRGFMTQKKAKSHPETQRQPHGENKMSKILAKGHISLGVLVSAATRYF